MYVMKPLKSHIRAIDALKIRPMTIKQLSDALNLGIFTVYRTMSELAKHGEVYRTTDRAYAYGRAYYVFHLMGERREET